jgi:hypothetical protein
LQVSLPILSLRTKSAFDEVDDVLRGSIDFE